MDNIIATIGDVSDAESVEDCMDEYDNDSADESINEEDDNDSVKVYDNSYTVDHIDKENINEPEVDSQEKNALELLCSETKIKSTSPDKKDIDLNKEILSLCELSFDKDAARLLRDMEGKTVDPNILIGAAGNCSKETFKVYIDKYPEQLDFQDNNGMTALMHCSTNDNEDLVKILLDKGADVNLVNNKKQSAFMIACVLNCIDTVNTFVKHKKLVDQQDITGSYAIHHVCRDGYDEIIDTIIENKDIYGNLEEKLTHKNIIGKTPIDYALEGFFENRLFEEALISLLNEVPVNRFTGINWYEMCLKCVSHGNYGVMKHILMKFIDYMDDSNISTLMILVLTCTKRKNELLVFKDNITPEIKVKIGIFQYAIEIEKTLLLKLKEILKDEKTDQYGNNILHYASILDNHILLTNLIKHINVCAMASKVNIHGYTPILYMIINRNKMIKYLLENGLSINYTNQTTKDNAFTIALKNKDTESLTMIVNHKSFDASTVEKKILIKLLKFKMIPPLNKLINDVPADYVNEIGNTLLLKAIKKERYQVAINIIKNNKTPMIDHLNKANDNIIDVLSVNCNDSNEENINRVIKEVFRRKLKDKKENGDEDENITIHISKNAMENFIMKEMITVSKLLLYYIGKERRNMLIEEDFHKIPLSIANLYIESYPEQFNIDNIDHLLLKIYEETIKNSKAPRNVNEYTNRTKYDITDSPVENYTTMENIKKIVLRVCKKGNKLNDLVMLYLPKIEFNIWKDIFEMQAYETLTEDCASLILKHICDISSIDKGNVEYFNGILDDKDIRIDYSEEIVETCVVNGQINIYNNISVIKSLIKILEINETLAMDTIGHISSISFNDNIKSILEKIPIHSKYVDFTFELILKIMGYAREDLIEFLFFRNNQELFIGCIEKKKVFLDEELLAKIKKHKFKAVLAFIHFGGYHKLPEKIIDYSVTSKTSQETVINMYNNKDTIKRVWNSGYTVLVEKMMRMRHDQEVSEYENYELEMKKISNSEEEEVDMPEYLHNLIGKEVKINSGSTKGLKCPTCLEVNSKFVMFEPCCHVGMCKECSKLVNNCPVCAKKVFSFIDVYSI